MRSKNGVRYFLFLIFVGLFFYFTNDFGLVGAQKTAIVTAIGIEREEDGFALSVQIANPAPKSGGKGGQSGNTGSEEYPVFESKGKTVAAAMLGVERATGWQVKLVFCRLIVLGRTLTEGDSFDALGYFLLNEYMNEGCLVAATGGQASEIVKAKTPLGPSSALAVEKILSPTAKKAGTALPVNLKDFAARYYQANPFGVLPLLEKEGEELKAEKVALFQGGRMVLELTEEESFALSASTLALRLASYTTQVEGVDRTLSIRQSKSARKLRIEDGKPRLKLEVTVYAGIEDNATAMPVEDLKDAGSVPKAVFAVASESLAAQITALHEKCKAAGFDIFGATELLKKYSYKEYETQKEGLAERLTLDLTVRFEGVR